jgi:hypothetical protein
VSSNTNLGFPVVHKELLELQPYKFHAVQILDGFRGVFFSESLRLLFCLILLCREHGVRMG